MIQNFRKFLIISFSLSFFFIEAAPEKPVQIVLITDSNDFVMDQTCDVLCYELKKLVRDEFNIECIKKNEYANQWSVQEISEAVENAMNDPSIDIVVGMGAVSSNEIVKREKLNKPAFAPFLLNLEMQGINNVGKTSGVKNLNYLNLPINLERDFSVFHQLTHFKRLHIIMNKYVQDAIPGIREAFHDFAKMADIEIKFIEIADFFDPNSLTDDVEAVYLLSMPQMKDEELSKLAQELIKRKIPSFSLFSKRYLDLGFLASMSPDTDMPILLRRLALNIYRTLLGENPENLPIMTSGQNQLTINMKVASELQFSVPWEILQQAVLINCCPNVNELTLSLYDTVSMGLKDNLDLMVAKQVLEIGKLGVKKATSALLPQVGIAGVYSRIDKDRALGSFGVYPEHALWTEAKLSQVLYSNETFGAVSVEKKLQTARENDYNISKLDIIYAVAISYLNLLHAQTVEDVHRKNLEKTRNHLKLSEERVKVGSARKSEVYRWESQYANDLTKVIEAGYYTKSVETCIKRLLNLPQEKTIHVEKVNLDESYWIVKKEWLEKNVIDDKSLEKYIAFSIYEGLCLSEDIKKLQREINAQCEVLGIAKRALWTPEVYLEASVRDRNREWGAGTKLPALYNSTDWAYTLNVTFPLYTGGYKQANKQQAYKKLKALQIELASQIEKEKEKIRRSTYEAVSSYTSIGLAAQSYYSAEKNFELVEDAYSKGTLPIVDLLDAQNQTLVADLVTAETLYNFLTDLMAYQRSLNRFDFFMDDYDANSWVNNINNFFKKNEGNLK